MDVTPNGRVLTPRPVHDTVADLLAGCTDRRPFAPADPRSATRFESVTIDGERLILKHVHLDDDFTMRVSGDLGCRPLRVWEAGLMDLAPDAIDHAVAGGRARRRSQRLGRRAAAARCIDRTGAARRRADHRAPAPRVP